MKSTFEVGSSLMCAEPGLRRCGLQPLKTVPEHRNAQSPPQPACKNIRLVKSSSKMPPGVQRHGNECIGQAETFMRAVESVQDPVTVVAEAPAVGPIVVV